MQRYSSEVDVDFVRKSIKAIGQTAVKIDAAAERCVNVLLELIGTRISYVVQEAVVVMKVNTINVAHEYWFKSYVRTYSENIHQHTRVSYQLYVPTSTSWMSQRQRHHSSGLLESMPKKLTMQAIY
jgi:vesicle coat complex subunit